MLALHELTDAFAAGYLAYGLGLEAQWNGGKPSALMVCGYEAYGHGGEDYGSGAPLAFYVPSLKLGVTFAMTAAGTQGGPYGMNCSMSWNTLSRAPSMAMEELFNAVTAAAGLTPGCAAADYSYEVPDASTCVDAPSFGKLNGTPVPCAWLAQKLAAGYGVGLGVVCNAFLAVHNLAYVRDSWAPSVNATYEPPAGYDAEKTPAIELCKGVCMSASTGPCWLRGPSQPWCATTGSWPQDHTLFQPGTGSLSMASFGAGILPRRMRRP
jgi:hypothetical protein